MEGGRALKDGIPLALLHSSLIQFDYLRKTEWNAGKDTSPLFLIDACHPHLGLLRVKKKQFWNRNGGLGSLVWYLITAFEVSIQTVFRWSRKKMVLDGPEVKGLLPISKNHTGMGFGERLWRVFPNRFKGGQCNFVDGWALKGSSNFFCWVQLMLDHWHLLLSHCNSNFSWI